VVRDEQVRLLRQKRLEGKTQEAAAAAAGMSVRTAREWERGPLPSEERTTGSSSCRRPAGIVDAGQMTSGWSRWCGLS